jgi:histidinol-phosphate aminotransferase
LDAATILLAAIAELDPTVVLITTPNNPTGTSTPLAVIEEVLAGTDAIVVVDEAYQEFARHPEQTALSLLAEHGNLVVSRTMSKAFAFAGGRLGYLAAAPAIVDACRIVRLPYHLSAQTQAVASVALRTPTRCWPASTSCAPPATNCCAGAPRWVSTWSTRTPTSS